MNSKTAQEFLQWLILVSLVGWCGYLQWKVNDVGNGTSVSSSDATSTAVVQRLSTLELTSQSTTDSLRISFNSDFVFAFIDIIGTHGGRRYLDNTPVKAPLDSAFNQSTFFGNITWPDVEALSFYEFVDFGVPDVASKAYLSDTLRVLCSKSVDQMDPICMALPAPVCNFLNLVGYVSREPFVYANVMMGLSYAACDSIPSNATESNGTAT